MPSRWPDYSLGLVACFAAHHKDFLGNIGCKKQLKVTEEEMVARLLVAAATPKDQRTPSFTEVPFSI